MTDPGRVVVVAAGFALWQGGRCVAAARWSDIRRLRAYRRPATDADAIRLGVELRDGSLMELQETAPGFDLFLDRASVTLNGLLPFAAWHPALMIAPSDAEGTVIFERKGN
jgi:hypothetical protein